MVIEITLDSEREFIHNCDINKRKNGVPALYAPTTPILRIFEYIS
jgi:hypothetical protein